MAAGDARLYKVFRDQSNHALRIGEASTTDRLEFESIRCHATDVGTDLSYHSMAAGGYSSSPNSFTDLQHRFSHIGMAVGLRGA